MAYVLTMLRLSDTMTEGVLLKWKKKEGDRVEVGDVIAEVETDKAVMDLESPEAGVLRRYVILEGATVPVGAPIAIIAEADEKIDDVLASLKGSGDATRPVSTKPPPKVVKAPEALPKAGGTAIPSLPEPAETGDGRIKVSPLAARMAAEHGVKLDRIKGSGPGGRVVKKDVEAVLAAGASSDAVTPPAPAELPVAPYSQKSKLLDSGDEFLPGETMPHSQMRKTIARRMTQSKPGVPHYYLTIAVDMENAIDFRSQLNKALPESDKISMTDVIVKASARALMQNPRVNSSWTDGATVLHPAAHIGLAVALPDGILTPVIRNCERRGLLDISRERRLLTQRARERKLAPEQFTGGTFSISNLGMYDIAHFTAIIAEPETAILAVGMIRDIAVVRNGQVVPGKRMDITMSCDHRVIDGAVGAAFMRDLKGILENPATLTL